jgi:segregation and condensation protein A
LSEVTIEDLLSLAQEALDSVSGPPVGEVVSPVTVTIEEQIDHIEHQLSLQQHVIFRTLLSGAASRLEVIVTLLALLELIKQDRVRVRQDSLFGEIIIQKPTKISNNPDRGSANPRT